MAEARQSEGEKRGEEPVWLQDAGYRLAADTGVWKRPDFSGIPYSDGDETEERLLSIVRSASDLSVFSPELHALCTDWPSLYHLGKSRANVLRPFEQRLRGAEVLEVGAGCGAITRYLGEAGARVTALEGSVRRASIARARTRDLRNVEIVADSFSEATLGKQYDVVTLIGVFEYAHIFVGGESPAHKMLSLVRKFLKPEGILLIAIENQLGLKYWAGAKEDHVGIEMFGLESRYSEGQVHTYGLKTLRQILKTAHFTNVEVLAPFPDYKLPLSVLSEAAFGHPNFDAAPLVRQAIVQDVQLPRDVTLALERVSETVTRNGLGLELANSFLIAASSSTGVLLEPGVLAYHFSTRRSSRFAKQAVFREVGPGTVRVQSEPLTSLQGGEGIDGIVSWRLSADVPYAHGTQMSAKISDVMAGAGWRAEEVAHALLPYLEFLQGNVVSGDEGKGLAARMPPDWLDVIPQNVILTTKGDPIYIDQEWVFHEPVPVSFIVFRALLSTVNTGCQIQAPTPSTMSVEEFFLEVFGALGFSVTGSQIADFARCEAQIQQCVTETKLEEDWWQPTRKVASPRSVWTELSRLQSAERDANAELSVLRAFRQGVESSASWRVARSLRILKQRLRGLLGRRL